jgi:hypothetical protein
MIFSRAAAVRIFKAVRSTLTAQGSTPFVVGHQVEQGTNHSLIFNGTGANSQVTALNGMQIVGLALAGGRTVTTTTTALYTDDKLDCYAAGGSYTITLPTLVTGKLIIVKKKDNTNTVTIAVASGQALDGVTNGTKTITTTNQCSWFISGGNGSWDMINPN